MNHILKKLLEIERAKDNFNLEFIIKENSLIINDLVYCHEALSESKKKSPEWLVYSDTLMSKIFFHANTLNNIARGLPIVISSYNISKPIVDVNSAYVVERALIESVLMYNLIYIIPKTAEEKEYNFNVWMYSSLIDRQKFPAKSIQANATKSKDLIAINSVFQQIEKSKYFSKLTQNQKDKIKNKGAHKIFNSWKQLIVLSGFKEEIENHYSFISIQAHSEALSVIQLKQSSVEQKKIAIFSILNITCCILSNLLLKIVKEHKVIEIKYNMLKLENMNRIQAYDLLCQRKAN